MKKLIGIFAMLAILVPITGANAAASDATVQDVPVISVEGCTELTLNSGNLALHVVHDADLCAQPDACAGHAGACCASITSLYVIAAVSMSHAQSSSHMLSERTAPAGITPQSQNGPPKHLT